MLSGRYLSDERARQTFVGSEAVPGLPHGAEPDGCGSCGGRSAVNKSRLLGNAMITAVRIILSAATTFVVYRYLLDHLGEQVLGVWALILAITAAGAVGSLGLNGTLVKHVASANSPDHRGYRIEMLHTAVIAAGLFLLLIALLLLAAGPFVLSLVVPEPLLAIGADVFLPALAAFWFAAVAALYQSYCEGLQRYLLTNGVLLGGSILYAVLCLAFVPSYGLPAVAMAALAQAVSSLAALLVACRLLPDKVPLLPGRWSGRLFRQLLPYGVRLQGMSIASMLYDPVTKFLVGFFGGIGHAAYYDMASRLVGMSRQLLVGANTTLLPAIAGMHSSDPGRLEDAHQRDYRVMFAAATVMLLGPAALARQIATAWLGSAVPEFVLALILLSAGWFVNTVSAPSYLFFLGRGELRWPMASHLVIALLNPFLGVLLGRATGYTGVVSGFAIAIAAGSVVTIVAYERGRGRSAASLLDRSAVRILVMSVVTIVLCHAAFLLGTNNLGHPTLLITGVILYGLLTWLTLRRSPGMVELRHVASVLSAPDFTPGPGAE